MSIQRIVLNINGVDREILCEPEKDSLADVVRRLGLTGTKVGRNRALRRLFAAARRGGHALLRQKDETGQGVCESRNHRGHRLGGTASSVAAGVHDVCERAVRLLFAGVHHVGQRASDAQS